MATVASRSQSLSVFVSYSRQNLVFVDRLQAALIARGVKVAVDRSDIEKGEVWWKRLQQLITEADTIVFVLSPDSVNSKVCQDEVAFGESLNKRFIPIVAEPIDGIRVPDALARLNYIFFVAHDPSGTTGDFDQSIDQLVTTLETNIDWVREHTRLGAIAQHWLAQDRGGELLLRGAELIAAEQWMATRPPKAPDPNDAHRALLAASRAATTRRQRWWLAGSTGIAAGALALAGMTYLQSVEALRQRDLAEQQRDATLRTESRLLASISEKFRSSGDAVAAATIALEALPSENDQFKRPVVAEALAAAYAADREITEQMVLDGHAGVALGVAFSRDGTRVLSRAGDGTARIWSVLTGTLQHILPQGGDAVRIAAWGRSDRQIVTASDEAPPKVWDAETGQLIKTLGPPNSSSSIAEFGKNMELLITTDGSNCIIWETRSWSEFRRFPCLAVSKVWFSRDGKVVALANKEGRVHLFETTTGEHIAKIGGEDDNIEDYHIDGGFFLPSGDLVTYGRASNSIGATGLIRIYSDKSATPKMQIADPRIRRIRGMISGELEDATLVSWSSEGDVHIWDHQEGKLIRHVHASDNPIWDMTIAPDQQFMVAAIGGLPGISFASGDESIALFRSDGEKLGVLRGHAAAVRAVAVSSDGTVLASASSDKTVRLWRLGSQSRLKVRPGHLGRVQQVGILPNALVSAGDDRTVRFWNRAGGEPIALEGHGRDVQAMAISGGGLVATGSEDGAIIIWDSATNLSKQQFSAGFSGVRALRFASDDLLVVGSFDGAVQLFDLRVDAVTAAHRRHRAPIIDMQYARDTNSLLTTDKDGASLLWKLASNTIVDFSEMSTARMLWSGGARLAVASADNVVRLRNIETSTDEAALGPFASSVTTIAISERISKIAVGTSGGEIELFEIGTLNPSKRIKLPKEEVLKVDFVVGGRAVLALTQSRILLVDVASGIILDFAALPGGSTPISMPFGFIHLPPSANGFAVASDEHSVAFASADNVVEWRLHQTVGELIASVQSRLPRCLTVKQRREAGLNALPPSWCLATSASDAAAVGPRLPKWPYGRPQWVKFAEQNARHNMSSTQHLSMPEDD